MRKKILIPAWSFYPSQEGGPSNALYWLASALSYANFEVRVVATNRCLPKGVVVENAWVKFNGFEVIYAQEDLYFAILNEEVFNCDILISSGVCMFQTFKLNIKAILLCKRVILSPRGELLDSAIYHKGVLYGLLKRLLFYIMSIFYRNKVLFHATSYEEEIAIRKCMGQRVKVVEIPNYMILPSKLNKDTLNCNYDYLLYVGRLNQIKNIDIIIKGLAKSKRFIDGQYKLKLAGDPIGPYYEYLVGLVQSLALSDKVQFLGMVTGDDKIKLYSQAKCLLLMSKSENFGNVVVESLSQGTPVIASHGTPWQILSDKGAGWWINASPDDVATFVDELLMLDVGVYTQMRNNAFELSRDFDVYANVHRWVGVINM